MEVIHIVAVVLLGLLVLTIMGVLFAGSESAGAGFLVASAIIFVVTLIVGWMAIGPEYRLWRASIEKRIAVEEARATADSAIELARAEVERAKGTAEANIIVAESITEPYLRYLYIINIADTDNQIIYLPTEAGLPILEADRFRQNNTGE